MASEKFSVSVTLFQVVGKSAFLAGALWRLCFALCLPSILGPRSSKVVEAPFSLGLVPSPADRFFTMSMIRVASPELSFTPVAVCCRASLL